MPGGHACETRSGGGAGRHVPTRLNYLLTHALAEKNVGVVKVFKKCGEERVAIRSNGFLNAFEHAGVHALRIVRSLQKKGRDRGDENRMAHAFGSVFPDVTRDLTASHRESHESEILKIKMCDDLLQVLGESVVVVAGGRLTGFAEASAIVGDHATASRKKRGDLLFPGSSAQRIPVD